VISQRTAAVVDGRECREKKRKEEGEAGVLWRSSQLFSRPRDAFLISCFVRCECVSSGFVLLQVI